MMLIILTSFITTTGQAFLKVGTGRGIGSFAEIFTNVPLIIGFLLYVIGAVLMIIAFAGAELSVLYPLLALTYIWVALVAYFYFNEPLSTSKVIGLIFIVLGVSFIGIGSRKKMRHEVGLV